MWVSRYGTDNLGQGGTRVSVLCSWKVKELLNNGRRNGVNVSLHIGFAKIDRGRIRKTGVQVAVKLVDNFGQ